METKRTSINTTNFKIAFGRTEGPGEKILEPDLEERFFSLVHRRRNRVPRWWVGERGKTRLNKFRPEFSSSSFIFSCHSLLLHFISSSDDKNNYMTMSFAFFYLTCSLLVLSFWSRVIFQHTWCCFQETETEDGDGEESWASIMYPNSRKRKKIIKLWVRARLVPPPVAAPSPWNARYVYSNAHSLVKLFVKYTCLSWRWPRWRLSPCPSPGSSRAGWRRPRWRRSTRRATMKSRSWKGFFFGDSNGGEETAEKHLPVHGVCHSAERLAAEDLGGKKGEYTDYMWHFCMHSRPQPSNFVGSEQLELKKKWRVQAANQRKSDGDCACGTCMNKACARS